MSESITKSRIKLVSLICSLLVVTLHLGFEYFYRISSSSSFCNKLVYFFLHFIQHSVCRVAVPYFMFKAGYLYYLDFDGTFLSYLRKTKRRFFSLFIPYVIWNAINFLFTFLICSIPFTQKYVAVRQIPKFDIIGVLLLRIGYAPNWFLQYLIIFSIVLPAFLRLYKVKLAHLITIIVLILIYVFAQNNEVYYGLIFYMIGIFFSINYKNLKFNFNISSLIIFVVTSLLILLIGHEHRIILFLKLFFW